MPKLIRDTRDKYQMALDVMMGYDPAQDGSLQESEVKNYPRIEQTPSFTEMMDFIQEEATTATAVYLFTNAQNKALNQFYDASDEQEWKRFTKVSESKDFKPQQRILYGGIAGLKKRSEGQTYPDLGFPPVYKSEFTPDTIGGLISITREIMKNDDLDSMQALIRESGRAAQEDLKKFVYGLVIGNAGKAGVNTDTLHDNKELFHASHGNLGSDPLSISALNARRSALEDQWVPGQTTKIDDVSGIDNAVQTIGLLSTHGFSPGAIIRIDDELIKVGAVDEGNGITGCTRGMYGTTPAAHSDEADVTLQARPVSFRTLSLLVPKTLKNTGFELLNSEKVPGSNYNNRNIFQEDHSKGKIELIAVHPYYLGDDNNNWYLIADYDSIPGTEVGFVDGREEPELIIQDGPTEGKVYDCDRIRYKVRHEYSGVQTDWRGIQGSLVADS